MSRNLSEVPRFRSVTCGKLRYAVPPPCSYHHALRPLTNHVLVVDDHEAWRSHIRSLLDLSGAWQISSEASDGRQAIQMARTLRPDLILLDIELPSLNGIDAARAILASNPRSKILFVSAHRSWDIVEAALGTGAHGYVLKTVVGDELLTAMDAILGGGRFISAVLTGRVVDGTKDPCDQYRSRCHEAAFYSDDTSLLDDYARFAGDALAAGSAVVYCASESRTRAVHQRLEARGLDVDLAIRQRRLLSAHIAELFTTFMVDGWPDEARFWQNGHALIAGVRRAVAGPRPRLAACGDGTASLIRDSRADAAIRLEQLWDEFAKAYNVDIFCGYPAEIARDDAAGVFSRICATHSAVYSR